MPSNKHRDFTRFLSHVNLRLMPFVFGSYETATGATIPLSFRGCQTFFNKKRKPLFDAVSFRTMREHYANFLRTYLRGFRFMECNIRQVSITFLACRLDRFGKFSISSTTDSPSLSTFPLSHVVNLSWYAMDSYCHSSIFSSNWSILYPLFVLNPRILSSTQTHWHLTT